MDDNDAMYRIDGMNIELTTRCPLRCPQCYCSLEGGKDIPVEIAKKRIAEAAALGVTHIEMSGGETLCYPHLNELVSEARKRNISTTISISGWGFTAKALNELIEAGIDSIAVSLNGPTKAINSITRDGYDYAINALNILHESEFDNIFLNWVMHQDAVEYLDEMVNLAERYGVYGIVIIEPRPSASGFMKSYPTSEQIRKVANRIRNNHSNVELIVQHCFSPLLALCSENKLWGNRNRGVYKGCTAGICSMTVTVDGYFAPCRHLYYTERFEGLQQYWNDSKVLRLIRDNYTIKHGDCIQCKLSDYCRHCISDNGRIDFTRYIGQENCRLKQ